MYIYTCVCGPLCIAQCTNLTPSTQSRRFNMVSFCSSLTLLRFRIHNGVVCSTISQPSCSIENQTAPLVMACGMGDQNAYKKSIGQVLTL